MPYIFVFLVGINAAYLGYQLLQENQPTLLQPITAVTHQDFPVTLELVSEKPLFPERSHS
ncbi:hypothetical protein [Aquirhabdus sp.]|uniref:hypothetical protein n=1 Tax=Aquirhabdus sp. TaxID=2824160 RepID=UPI00396CAFCB